MFNYRGGNSVKRGFYWNLKAWEIVTVSKKGGVLPGGEAQRYVKLPALLMVVMAPILGLLYVIFLPFIGFALVLGALGWELVRALRRAVAELRSVLRAALRV